MKDSLQIASENVYQHLAQDNTTNWWMIISIVEFVVILLSFYRFNNKRNRVKQRIKNEGDIDFANIVDSAFGAERMYKKLIRQCHPDRFAPDENKMAIANDITERLGKYKNDLKGLEMLKTEAINKLNINI